MRYVANLDGVNIRPPVSAFFDDHFFYLGKKSGQQFECLLIVVVRWSVDCCVSLGLPASMDCCVSLASYLLVLALDWRSQTVGDRVRC